MAADLIFINGTILTVNPDAPTAEACAVKDGRILAVGSRLSVEAWGDSNTCQIDLEGACLMPGFIDAHGHPTSEANMWGSGVVDIRPATLPEGPDVIDVIQEAVHHANNEGVYFDGWDPLLQDGLPQPTLNWLDTLAPDKPIGIMHNSGHSAYFNSKLMELVGLSHDTPDPFGAHYERDNSGNLTGTAYEAAAIMSVMAPALQHSGSLRAKLQHEFKSLSQVGVTTIADMAFTADLRPTLDEMARSGELTSRLRLYEMSTPQGRTRASLDNGDDLIKQIGVKTWADGSPWVGNIATSFTYLDTPQTHTLGIEPGRHTQPIYTRNELREISQPYFESGWQLACHAHGDIAIDTVLDAWEEILDHSPRDDHRLRIEHCGAMQPAQYHRAASMGVTCSLFIDHIRYWGDVLADGLFGQEHSEGWVAAKSALDAGVRISLHNDIPVTPEEPLRNISVAVTRKTRSGQVLGAHECISVAQAIRAQTIDAAWQLFMDDIVGSIEPGKYADLVILSDDPRTVDSEAIADIDVRATFLAGKQVFGESLCQ